MKSKKQEPLPTVEEIDKETCLGSETCQAPADGKHRWAHAEGTPENVVWCKRCEKRATVAPPEET